ncbi:MAG: helix-turn-helix domain-containing protein [Promethearchaeota archaeon]|jgi:hypothetical protein
MSEKKSYYAIIPAEIRYDNKLCPNAKLLYGEITALCNEKGYCWASNEYFAKLYKVHKNTISRWVVALDKLGFIHTLTERNGEQYLRKIWLTGSVKSISKIVEGKRKECSPVNKKVVTSQQKGVDNNTYNNTINKTIDSCRIHKLNDKRKHKYVWCTIIKTLFCPNNEKYCINECYVPCRDVTDEWALRIKKTSRENLWQCRKSDPGYKTTFKKVVEAFKERDPGGLSDKIRRWRNMTKEQIEEYNARPLKRVQE